MKTAKTPRNANIELLRILSMVMVTVLHALGKADLLWTMNGNLPLNGWVAWGFEVLSMGAVNIFMLITGYFLVDSRFRVSRLLEIVFQTVFYTFGTFIVFFALGLLTPEDKTVYGLLQYIFPVHMEVFWFITAYCVLYMIIPLLSAGLSGISRKQLGTVIILLLVYESLFKSLLPVRLTVDDKGYSFIWYLTVALVGAYFRLFGFAHLTKSVKGWIAYICAFILAYAEIFAIDRVYAGSGRLASLLRIPLEYNHIFNLLLAIGIFAAILKARPIEGVAAKVICAISPLTLGVYLLQENILLRYRWQGWFGLKGALNDPLYIFLLKLFAAVVCMFFLGIAVDKVRALISKVIFGLFAGKDNKE